MVPDSEMNGNDKIGLSSSFTPPMTAPLDLLLASSSGFGRGCRVACSASRKPTLQPHAVLALGKAGLALMDLVPALRAPTQTILPMNGAPPPGVGPSAVFAGRPPDPT